MSELALSASNVPESPRPIEDVLADLGYVSAPIRTPEEVMMFAALRVRRVISEPITPANLDAYLQEQETRRRDLEELGIKINDTSWLS